MSRHYSEVDVENAAAPKNVKNVKNVKNAAAPKNVKSTSCIEGVAKSGVQKDEEKEQREGVRFVPDLVCYHFFYFRNMNKKITIYFNVKKTKMYYWAKKRRMENSHFNYYYFFNNVCSAIPSY